MNARVSIKLEITIYSSKNIIIRKNIDERTCIAITTVYTNCGFTYASFFIMNIPRIVNIIPKLTHRNGDSN